MGLRAANAGQVRTLYTNDRMMPVISLAMGRSTVLRFDEKPRSAVVGNQNYFALEYIGNDITIQPQGATTSNLFVYTEFQTYGLILRVSGRREGAYDDLVNIRWKPGYLSVTDSSKKRITLVSEVALHRKLTLKGMVRLDFIRVIHSVAHGVMVLDFSVENLSKEPLTTQDLQITVAAAMKPGPGPTPAHLDQKVAMREEILPAGALGTGRVILKVDQLESAEVTVTLHRKAEKLMLSRRVTSSRG